LAGGALRVEFRLEFSTMGRVPLAARLLAGFRRVEIPAAEDDQAGGHRTGRRA
jgi:hypothetical protein